MAAIVPFLTLAGILAAEQAFVSLESSHPEANSTLSHSVPLEQGTLHSFSLERRALTELEIDVHRFSSLKRQQQSAYDAAVEAKLGFMPPDAARRVVDDAIKTPSLSGVGLRRFSSQYASLEAQQAAIVSQWKDRTNSTTVAQLFGATPAETRKFFQSAQDAFARAEPHLNELTRQYAAGRDARELLSIARKGLFGLGLEKYQGILEVAGVDINALLYQCFSINDWREVMELPCDHPQRNSLKLRAAACTRNVIYFAGHWSHFLGSGDDYAALTALVSGGSLQAVEAIIANGTARDAALVALLVARIDNRARGPRISPLRQEWNGLPSPTIALGLPKNQRTPSQVQQANRLQELLLAPEPSVARQAAFAITSRSPWLLGNKSPQMYQVAPPAPCDPSFTNAVFLAQVADPATRSYVQQACTQTLLFDKSLLQNPDPAVVEAASMALSVLRSSLPRSGSNQSAQSDAVWASELPEVFRAVLRRAGDGPARSLVISWAAEQFVQRDSRFGAPPGSIEELTSLLKEVVSLPDLSLLEQKLILLLVPQLLGQPGQEMAVQEFCLARLLGTDSEVGSLALLVLSQIGYRPNSTVLDLASDYAELVTCPALAQRAKSLVALATGPDSDASRQRTSRSERFLSTLHAGGGLARPYSRRFAPFSVPGGTEIWTRTTTAVLEQALTTFLQLTNDP
jgi:hypothetical protein